MSVDYLFMSFVRCSLALQSIRNLMYLLIHWIISVNFCTWTKWCWWYSIYVQTLYLDWGPNGNWSNWPIFPWQNIAFMCHKAQEYLWHKDNNSEWKNKRLVVISDWGNTVKIYISTLSEDNEVLGRLIGMHHRRRLLGIIIWRIWHMV